MRHPNLIPSYYFDFTLESNGSKACFIDLEWISKKMGLHPSSTRLKGEKKVIFQQTIEAKFTQWSKQSRVYKDWNMDKNFEKFIDKFHKKTKTHSPNLANLSRDFSFYLLCSDFL